MGHEQCTSSGLQTADGGGAITQTCYLHAVTLIPTGADATVVVYDNATAATGTAVAKLFAPSATASVHFTFDTPVYCSNGIYADVTGASAGYIFYYSL